MKNKLHEVHNLRLNYEAGKLGRQSVRQNPFEQFEHWFEAVMSAGFAEPNAMFLATATPDGKPSVRTVLLKGFSHKGFTFFTNYHSRKGHEIAANPHAALLFYWDKLQQQVRIEGSIEKVPDIESDAYFDSRPEGSRIGALASPQSSVIASRKELDDKVAQLMEEVAANPHTLKRPEHWGGYLLQPSAFEFWQGRSNRLHDRIRYTLQPSGNWLIERLAP